MRQGLRQTGASRPLAAYGTSRLQHDELAFARLILAIALSGSLRAPVGNIPCKGYSFCPTV
jgi:hypothetical protein